MLCLTSDTNSTKPFLIASSINLWVRIFIIFSETAALGCRNGSHLIWIRTPYASRVIRDPFLIRGTSSVIPRDCQRGEEKMSGNPGEETIESYTPWTIEDLTREMILEWRNALEFLYGKNIEIETYRPVKWSTESSDYPEVDLAITFSKNCQLSLADLFPAREWFIDIGNQPYPTVVHILAEVNKSIGESEEDESVVREQLTKFVTNGSLSSRHMNY
jgi:hypothetical protein